MTTLDLRSSLSPAPLRRSFLLIPLALVSFALSPMAQAVTPAPDGGYANGNTAEGTGALQSLTSGSDNTANGFNTLFHNTTGSENTATGYIALQSNTTGTGNTANGIEALFHNTTGNFNTANGGSALFSNTTGSDNTASGLNALQSNNGNFNTANGSEALQSNTAGSDNTANGAFALNQNTTGSDNTANGGSALNRNTTGFENTANGAFALNHNTTGFDNTANGVIALNQNTTGTNNTANGESALFNNTTGSNNTASGFGALTRSTGSNNTALGSNAGGSLTTGSNNIDIGAPGVAGEGAKIRIGKQGTQNGTFIAGIFGVTMTGSPVVVSSSGKLGVSGTSSARFKESVKLMDKASEAVLQLKPVTFRYKKEIDPDGIPQFGLVAEEVEKVNPQLVIRDEEGKAYSVRYEAVNAMLLNEFLKEHRTVQDLKKEIAALTATVKEQAAQIQKVGAQVEVSKPAFQTVLNNQ